MQAFHSLTHAQTLLHDLNYVIYKKMFYFPHLNF